MTAQIFRLPTAAAAVPPVAQFIRLGEAHRRIEALLAENRFPASRVVVDASRLARQKRLVDALREGGVEIVLDTQAAELGSLAKFKGQARNAPWGLRCEERPLGPQFFSGHRLQETVSEIACFAVEHTVDVVLAPTHFLADPTFKGWFDLDRAACIALRHALDREGGTSIAIDYPLLHSHVALSKGAERSGILGGLAGLPFDYLWVRASGLDADAGPLTTKQFIVSLSSLHNLGKPIIIDYLGGLIGSAALTFGAASGKAHGIGERERFDARGWHKPVPEKDETEKFGRAVRIPVPGLGRTVTPDELEVLSSARGGRKLVACGDRNCCPNGLSDMLRDPRRHHAYQIFAELRAMSAVPELHRAQHFLDGTLNEAVRQARNIKRLRPAAGIAEQRKVDVSSLMHRMHEQARKLESLQSTLEGLHESRAGGAPRSRPAGYVRTRQNMQNQNER